MDHLIPSTKGILICLLLVLLNFSTECYSYMGRGMYCGLMDCYEIMGVHRNSTKAEISNAFRKLNNKLHPNRFYTAIAKEEAANRTKLIATAYATLNDEKSRSNYDYMLDYPDEVFNHLYNYFRRKYLPQVDLRILIVVVITSYSIAEYVYNKYRYNTVLRSLSRHTNARYQAWNYAMEHNMLGAYYKIKKRDKKAMKDEENRVILQVLVDNADIRGGVHPPTIYEVLWVRIVLLPLSTYRYVLWYVSWVWRFNIKKQEYGLVEKNYLIRRHFRFTESYFESLNEKERAEFLEAEIWIKEKFDAWIVTRAENRRRELAEISAPWRHQMRKLKNDGKKVLKLKKW